MNTLCSWSGGKDSCYALMQAIEQGYTPKVLLNMMNENGLFSRSHAISKSILQQQADRMQLPILLQPASWAEYEEKFVHQLTLLQQKYDLSYAVFGDIDIESHRAWEERVSALASLKPLLPLWQSNRKTLVQEMLQNGIKTIITSCNEKMGTAFLGRTLSLEMIDELEALDIDVCGENGEFHTLVIDCPLFNAPIILPDFRKVIHGNYCFLEWLDY